MSFDDNILSFFGLATVLATLSKLWANLFSIFCSLYYKHMTIVDDNSSVIIKWSSKLIDSARGVIYDRHMFKVQATGHPENQAKTVPGLETKIWFFYEFKFSFVGRKGDRTGKRLKRSIKKFGIVKRHSRQGDLTIRPTLLYKIKVLIK